jgi:hypothetical protein
MSKFLFALTFLPLLILDLTLDVTASIIWGLPLLTVLSFHIAGSRNVPPGRLLLEHIAKALMIIVITPFREHPQP